MHNESTTLINMKNREQSVESDLEKSNHHHQSSVNTRTILWFLVFTGFAINYMYRININIAIVNMIQLRKSVNKVENISECFNRTNDENLDEYETETVINKNGFSLEKYMFNLAKINYNGNGFDWNEYQQNLVLGSFFWLHWATTIPGAILVRRYGTKLMFGLSNLIGCVLAFVIPIASYTSINLVILIRVLQGIIGGVAFPSMHNLIAHWIPPNERGKFMAAYIGSSAGVSVFYPLFGFIMAVISWEWVFHFSAIIGIVWYVFWIYCVYDTPEKHPRISTTEKIFIQESLDNQNDKKQMFIPWKQILTSLQVWIHVIAQFGSLFAIITMTTQLPTYFRLIHGFSIRMTGIITGLPHFIRTFFSFIFGYVSDYLLEYQMLSRTNVRKLSGLFSFILNGICIIGLAYTGCQSEIAVAFVLLGSIAHGAHGTGTLASSVDISPNYASIIMGLCSIISLMSGFISPYIVGLLTYNNQNSTQWEYIFLITGLIMILCGLPYVLYLKANVQRWNKSMEVENSSKNYELKPLKKRAPIVKRDEL